MGSWLLAGAPAGPPDAWRERRADGRRAWSRLAGIPIRADATLLLMAGILVWSFWLRFENVASRPAAVAMALVAAVLFLGSVLAHELAHALEARRRGLRVEDITLYLFGGATRISTEVRRPADQFVLAAVGPWTSVVAGCAFGLVAYATGRAGWVAVAEVAGELGWLNVVLGIFNLLPGAPLDGGRLLEAVVWRATGDRTIAVRVATGAGRLLGWLLAALGLGVVVLVGGGFVGGFWLVLIGWFLARSAAAESSAATAADRLRGRSVRDLSTAVATVPLGASLEEAVRLCSAASRTDAALVVGPYGVAGVLECARVERVAPPARATARVERLMTPLESLPAVEMSAPASVLLGLVGVHPVLVQDGGSVVTVVTGEQLAAALRWLAPLPAARPAGPAPAAGERPVVPPSAGVARVIALAGSLGLVAAALGVVPMPVYDVAPGPALNVPSLVRSAGPVHPVDGRLLLTSVQIGSPAAAGVVRDLFDGRRDLVWQSSLVPAGMSSDEYDQWQRQLFRDSVQLAAAVALRHAGYAVQVSGAGAVVTAVETGGAADGALMPGDIVTGVGGSKVATASDLVAQVSRSVPGTPLVVDVQRGDQALRFGIRPTAPGALGRPMLGIAVQDASPSVRLPFEVGLALPGVGGPSAGLMTALSVYAVTSGADLAGGRTIAGTGTIDALGRVGLVGGIAQKVAAAAHEHAAVFLVPSGEAATAERAARGTGLRVVPVSTFSQAVERLRAMASPAS